MNSSSPTSFVLNKPPTFDAVVDTFGLELLRSAGDLKLKADGSDFEMTKDDDVVVGDKRFNALRRLVEMWRLNEPTLAMLFTRVAASQLRRTTLEAQIDALFVGEFDDRLPGTLHALEDEISADEIASEACAGAMVLVLNNLLKRLKDDLGSTNKAWRTSGHIVRNLSFGQIVEAAANNFRHHDEWASTNPPNSQQLASLRVLERLLKPERNDLGRIRHNVCPAVVLALGTGSYETFNQRFFAFAYGLATHGLEAPRG